MTPFTQFGHDLARMDEATFLSGFGVPRFACRDRLFDFAESLGRIARLVRIINQRLGPLIAIGIVENIPVLERVKLNNRQERT